jgi:hypothetical protein
MKRMASTAAVLVGAPELALDKGRVTALEQLQPLADAFVVGDPP